MQHVAFRSQRRRVWLVFLSVACLVGAAACRPRVLARDQDQFRQAILAYYENQVMDNLIRAQLGRAILQMDYTTVSGTVTDTISATLGGSYAHQKVDTDSTKNTDLTDLIKAAMSTTLEVAVAATKQITYIFNYSLTGSRGTQLAVTAKPVIDEPGVYQEYLRFLSLEGSLQSAAQAPASEKVHVQRVFEGRHYFVPAAFKKDFFRLTLKTTVMRGEPKEAPLSFAATVVDGVVDAVDEQGQVRLRLRLNPNTPIPNDYGTMKAKIDNGTYLLQVVTTDADPGAMITDIVVLYNHSAAGIPLPPNQVVAALRDQTVDIALANSKPKTKATKTEQLLDSIYSETLLNRLDSLRQP